jgi:hypothetical protein
MGRRMTVVRLPTGDLFVHSPADLRPELRAALTELGDVRLVVPASSLHGHASMGHYQRAYPDAELFATPGLARKRPELDFAGELGGRPDPRWADALDQTLFRGHRMLEEVVFLHRPSRSLIVGDTCFNIERDAPLTTRLWAWGPKRSPRAGPTPLFKLAIRDKGAARDSVERVLRWDFERIVVGHGAIVERDGPDVFREAWAWLW